jgi:hypothetical protein
MSAQLTSLVDAALVRAAAAAPAVRSQVEAARDLLRADLTVVVAGRRGTGKTRLIDSLVGGSIGVRRLAVQDRPVELFTAAEDGAPGWVSTTPVAAPYLEHRRIVELPDLAAGLMTEAVQRVADLYPDVLLYVAQQHLRTDEFDLLDRATHEWRLGAPDVVVVLMDPATGSSTGDTTSALGGIRQRLLRTRQPRFAQVVVAKPVSGANTVAIDPVSAAVRDVEPFIEARRAGEAMAVVAGLSATQSDMAWGADVSDDLERLTLSPTAHAMRERWALDECLSGRGQLSPELLADLVDLYLPSRSENHGVTAEARRAVLVSRAARWRTEAHQLPPRAAEVARIVVQSCRLRLADGSAQTTEIRSVTTRTGEVDHVPA